MTRRYTTSPDFNYSSSGFLAFFFTHSTKINQLEFGHSLSNILEEHYITPTCPFIGWTSLSSLLSNMTEFICSTDVKWNWESADWIGPHVLLPSHPRLQLIGVHDIRRGNWLLIVQMHSLLRDVRLELSKVQNRLEPNINMMLFWQAILDSCGGRGWKNFTEEGVFICWWGDCCQKTDDPDVHGKHIRTHFKKDSFLFFMSKILAQLKDDLSKMDDSIEINEDKLYDILPNSCYLFGYQYTDDLEDAIPEEDGKRHDDDNDHDNYHPSLASEVSGPSIVPKQARSMGRGESQA
ncbi:hypothetical protein ARMGADRAFT_1105154 [Armillaria gallica]|uniref:Uncharacterized protein n=1 Tax=Armillaria gallica TaxID=47427 RepID=A0A2H3CST4_ARMGA|nr:hypothetical protein ARMGADRAFT_1105154 [Armillaria gallica]